MYLMPDMIDMGVEEGGKFPSEAHRTVCINVVIGRPGFDQLDHMIDVIKAVNKIPNHRIKNVTIGDLINEFNVPYIN